MSFNRKKKIDSKKNYISNTVDLWISKRFLLKGTFEVTCWRISSDKGDMYSRSIAIIQFCRKKAWLGVLGFVKLIIYLWTRNIQDAIARTKS